MDLKVLHKRVQNIAVATNKLLTDLETEMGEAETQAQAQAEHASAVEQARREILAEQAAASKSAGAPK